MDFTKYIPRFKLPPYEHQLKGIEHVLAKPHVALFDEMGVGKTKQIIDSACILFEEGQISAVVIVAPASTRGVWDDREFGEIKKHCWVPYETIRYDAKFHTRIVPNPSLKNTRVLKFIVVSYSYLRRQVEVDPKRIRSLSEGDVFIKKLRAHKFFLVLDESSYVKSRTAAQTKACWKVRQFATRSAILNGTPIGNTIMDLWAQLNIMDSESIGHMNYFQFRHKYAKMGGWKGKQVIGVNEEEVIKLRKQVKPWIIRRIKNDCLDLPDKIYTHLEVELSPDEWKFYEQMREDMVAWVSEAEYSQAVHGAVKAVRLSQITSGFIGGVDGSDPEHIENPCREIGHSKLEALLDWYKNNYASIGQLIVWSRFRAEIERTCNAFNVEHVTSAPIIGGQSDSVRQDIINSFKTGRVQILVGHPQAGGLGLNLTNANTVVYMSNDYSYINRLQSEDRVHRPGQTNKCTYVDMVAVSPTGRKTIDQLVLKILLKKGDLATWTVQEWRKNLAEL